MAQKQIAENFHFSIALGKSLFSDLLGAALPYRLVDGKFNLTENLRQAAHQLQVKQKVAGLLEGPQNEALTKVKDRAANLWGNNRERVYEVLEELVKVEGEWELELDADGSEFTYAEQRIGAEAYFKLSATGKATLLKQNIELPFTITKRLGAEVNLGRIRYDAEKQQIVGDLCDLGIDLGDNLALRVANDVVIKLIEQQTHRFNPLPVLKKEQLDGVLGGMADALKLNMEVTDVALDVGEEMMTLKVRFGFSRKQLEADGADKR